MSAKNDKASRSPQERASEHLKKMLRNAAVGGAALGLSGGCGSCGPMVCDPMPTPICDKNPTTSDFMSQGRLNASAEWQQSDAGARMVHVSLSLYNEGEAITFASDPALSGAQLVGAKNDSTTLTFDFVPAAGVTEVQAIIQLDCATRPEVLKLGFGVGVSDAGAVVTVSSLEPKTSR